MASATSSSQRDWGKVRPPRTPCPSPPAPTALPALQALTLLFLWSRTDRAWHAWGVPRSAPSSRPTTMDPSRGSPWAPCGGSESRYPRLPGLWGRAHGYWPPRSPCTWARTTLGTGGWAGLQAGSFRGVAQTWGFWGRGSRNRCDWLRQKSQAAGFGRGSQKGGVELLCDSQSQTYHLSPGGFRTQVSESGVHRPHVAGIHGRSNDGAYSLVLAGGYEDDVVSVGGAVPDF